MPSKGRKAASRQAQLNRKKRRSKNPRQPEFEAAPVMSRTAVETAVAEPEIDEPDAVEDSTPQPEAATRPAPRVRSTRRRGGSRSAAEEQTPLVYQYLSREIRQIGIITSLIVAILVGLTFVLR
ncbi:MAG: hypothetical protein IIC83_01205 [Chloroflexi bacterium]|nr:hypothetical protein [Chloroflexota bacterium]MCH9011357.1 hypothetical protein [Chloroflexota bacterium]